VDVDDDDLGIVMTSSTRGGRVEEDSAPYGEKQHAGMELDDVGILVSTDSPRAGTTPRDGFSQLRASDMELEMEPSPRVMHPDTPREGEGVEGEGEEDYEEILSEQTNADGTITRVLRPTTPRPEPQAELEAEGEEDAETMDYL